ncbi:hypothetical protein SAMN04488556_1114 [Halostagnicola kamekurae]|uniref:Uncharacterized protein n=1 Tax=Halostagnicola kamekurae TaxID=619731 RepID=A0A1I6QA75_9EURY|nr:hypothetical protein SAMN04488556_1114 [Halostagnicola kamekurae]
MLASRTDGWRHRERMGIGSRTDGYRNRERTGVAAGTKGLRSGAADSRNRWCGDQRRACRSTRMARRPVVTPVARPPVTRLGDGDARGRTPTDDDPIRCSVHFRELFRSGKQRRRFGAASKRSGFSTSLRTAVTVPAGYRFRREIARVTPPVGLRSTGQNRGARMRYRPLTRSLTTVVTGRTIARCVGDNRSRSGPVNPLIEIAYFRLQAG